MKILKDILQGSEAWHVHRSTHFNASDAPAMMGFSKYKTYNELLKEIATGAESNIPKFLADKGHEAERLARPLAEKIIGEELYPVIGYIDEYSASFDGLTMMQDINFEHKMLNDEIRSCNSIDDLNIMYKIQMTQQMAISGAKKTLFMATEWDGETLVESKEFWYEFNMKSWGQIKIGWDQFKTDLAAYVVPAAVEKVVADSIESLPLATIQAKGELVVSNLPEILPRFDLFLSSQKTVLVTDGDFINANAVAKFCRDTAATLQLTAKATIDQIASIGDAVRTLENYSQKFASLALLLEKLEKSEKESRKNAIISAARVKWQEHLDGINAELKQVHLQIANPDFVGAVKNKRTIESLQNAVDVVLAQAKINADALAKTYRLNLAWAYENKEEFNFLYANDLGAIVAKDHEDFKNLINARIEEFRKSESERISKALSENKEPSADVIAISKTVKAPSKVAAKKRPTDFEIIEVLSAHYQVDGSKVIEWLQDMDLAEASMDVYKAIS